MKTFKSGIWIMMALLFLGACSAFASPPTPTRTPFPTRETTPTPEGVNRTIAKPTFLYNSPGGTRLQKLRPGKVVVIGTDPEGRYYYVRTSTGRYGWIRLNDGQTSETTFAVVTAAPTPTLVPYAASKSSASSSLNEVRNNCGACGTNSPVGGWESTDGRSLILSENGNFTAFLSDGSSMRGTWSQTGNRLCLTTGSVETCFQYQQRLDAMKLDDAIYTRR